MAQPDGVTDDFSGKTMTLVAGFCCLYATERGKSAFN
jgi:hypothetical protein